jgi:NAD(P)-dependent dehydrogenase (short-subunit alcohol dehydrogenase family)
VVAPFVLAKLFEELLRKARGSIINIGSIHSKLTKSRFCAYSTSKAALSGLTRALALEFSGEVNVNVILPGATRTAMLLAGFSEQPEKYQELESFQPVGRIAEPEEIAHLALFLCSDNARCITGADFPIDGGIGGCLHDPA